jgi:hypothetical protein
LLLELCGRCGLSLDLPLQVSYDVLLCLQLTLQLSDLFLLVLDVRA